MKKLLYLTTLIALTSCGNGMTEDEINEIGIKPCRKPAPFITKLGFDANRSAFSTSQKNITGVALIQAPKTPNDTNDFKVYQDSSWKQFGFCGSLTTDENGNVYTATIPLVNTINAKPVDINKILKLDATSGKLNSFIDLPKPLNTSNIAPYSVLGVYYDCHGKKLYAATVCGSTADNETGVIYVIDLVSKKIVDELKGFDAMGIFVGGVNKEKRLFFGSARNSKVFSAELNKEGLFRNKNKVATEFTLDNLGPRGTDKARRIRFDKSGNMIIYGIEFNFNLAAQGDKPETAYQFNFDEESKKWLFYKILH